MKCVCDIICGKCGTYWFSDKKYNETSFEELSMAFANHPKVLSTLTKYWSREKSSMDIERSNRCAERAVYQANFFCNMTLKEEKMKLRFILSNDNE
ncbi:hypothetical protein GJ496_007192 [Pomphorhynchus laevis]|nr:hypothetical protein GJ496_007192 [Pomphorhynchus laevis]